MDYNAAMYVTVIDWTEDGGISQIILADPEAVDALTEFFDAKNVRYSKETRPVYGMSYVQTLIGG